MSEIIDYSQPREFRVGDIVVIYKAEDGRINTGNSYLRRIDKISGEQAVLSGRHGTIDIDRLMHLSFQDPILYAGMSQYPWEISWIRKPGSEDGRMDLGIRVKSSPENPTPDRMAENFKLPCNLIYVNVKDLLEHRKTSERHQQMNETAASRSSSQFNNVPANPNISSFPAVLKQILIFGKEASTVTDEEIFDHIARLENEVKKLDTIENKPKSLVAKIQSLKADINALVEFSDSRE